MSYHEWDYTNSNSDVLTIETAMRINNLFKENCTEKINSFFQFLTKNHKDFLFNYRKILLIKLINNKNFEMLDDLLSENNVLFDLPVAKTCAFSLSLVFEEESFMFFSKKIKELPFFDQSELYKNFWNEFLSFQFRNSVDFTKNIHHLPLVFEQIPFYITSEFDMLNKYLIESRENCFNNTLKYNLSNSNYELLLTKITTLSAQYYSNFLTNFQEEFGHLEQFEELLDLFKKTVLNTELTKKLPPKFKSPNNKI